MRLHLARTAVSLTALLAAAPAVADVTAQDVWDNWKANMAFYGDDGITFGSEIADGGTLTVADLTLTADDELSTITTSIGTIIFTENGDGTVSVAMQNAYPVRVIEKESDVEVDLEVAQQGLSILVSGDPDAMNYDVSADSYGISLADIRGADAPEVEAFMRANALSGSYQTDVSSGSNTTFGFATSSIDFLVDAKDPIDGNVLLSGKLEGVTTSGEWDLPEGADLDEPETFQDDFTFKGETNAANTAFLFDFDIEGDAGNGSVQAGAFKLGGDINDETFDYVVSLADAAVSIEVPDLPFPFEMSMSLFENVLAFPVSETEEPAPFTYRFALTDFSISDQIWAMGDPAGALPRDPATLIVDITGLVKMLGSIFDEETASGDDVPAEMANLTVNNVQLSAVGAEIKADGDFTFDNTDLDTFDGFPRPEGELNVGITGANALIDTLIEMGLLPQEQATMGRMMMGMFTQPSGDDALTSKIEINEQGHVLANGQRIQ